MSTARSYYDALLALSGKPALADAQRALLATIGEQDLREVVNHTLKSGISKGVLEYVAGRLLDVAVAERARKADKVFHKDDENDARDEVEVQGSSSGAQRGNFCVYMEMENVITGK
jgi:hypothetical protein